MDKPKVSRKNKDRRRARLMVENELRASDANYRDLVETSQDLIWQCDNEGRFTYLNPAWETTHGYTVAEMLGHCFTEFEEPNIANHDIQEFARHIEGGSVRGYETTHISKNGNRIHLVFNAIPLRDPAGRIVGTQGTAHDITESKQAEAALAESEKKFRNLVDNALVGIYKTNIQGEVLYGNDALVRLFEFDSAEEMMATGVSDRYQDKQDRARFLAELNEKRALRNYFSSSNGRGRPRW